MWALMIIFIIPLYLFNFSMSSRNIKKKNLWTTETEKIHQIIMKNVSVFFFSGHEQSYVTKWKSRCHRKKPTSELREFLLLTNQQKFFLTPPSTKRQTVEHWVNPVFILWRSMVTTFQFLHRTSTLDQTDFKTFCTKQRNFSTCCLNTACVCVCVCTDACVCVSKAVFIVCC